MAVQGVHGFYPPPPAIITIALSSQVPDLGGMLARRRTKACTVLTLGVGATFWVNAEGL